MARASQLSTFDKLTPHEKRGGGSDPKHPHGGKRNWQSRRKFLPYEQEDRVNYHAKGNVRQGLDKLRSPPKLCIQSKARGNYGRRRRCENAAHRSAQLFDAHSGQNSHNPGKGAGEAGTGPR